MRKRRLRAYILATVIAVAYLVGPGANRAEAYIDPGTGSHLLSTLGIMIGVVSTGVLIGIAQIRRCGEWFIEKFSARRHTDQHPE